MTAIEIDPEVLENPALHAWAIDGSGFPVGDTMEEALRFCIRYAVLAPSGHNTQPWWFAVEGNRIRVGIDPSRGLAVLDPDDREATMSVGAAIFTLRTALEHFGFDAAMSYWPDPLDPDACAEIEVTDRRSSASDLASLFPAITRRHTSRARFTDAKVSEGVLSTMSKDAGAEGAALHVVTDYPSRHALAELVSKADRLQFEDRSFRRELASWLRSAHTHRGDGIRGYGADGLDLMSVAAPVIVRTFDIGAGLAAKDVDLATGSPALAILCTDRDDRTAWLRAGQALARVALRATTVNVLLGFLDQPVEVASFRSAVAELVGSTGFPQLVLRLGYGPAPHPQPRRPYDDVFVRR